MKRYLAVAALVFLICFLCGVSPAQEEEKEALGYSYGTISNVSSNQIVVIEYDYDTGEEAAVTYTVDPDVKLYNADSLKDIASGSSVWVDYVVRKGEKVAMGIELKQLSDEEDAEEPSQELEY